MQQGVKTLIVIHNASAVRDANCLKFTLPDKSVRVTDILFISILVVVS